MSKDENLRKVMKHITTRGVMLKSEAQRLYGIKNIGSVIFQLRHRYGVKIKSKRFCTKKWYRLFKKKWDVAYTI